MDEVEVDAEVKLGPAPIEPDLIIPKAAIAIRTFSSSSFSTPTFIDSLLSDEVDKER